MHNEKDTITNRYTKFMGSWIAGSIIGHFLAKIITFIIFMWLLNEFICK